MLAMLAVASCNNANNSDNNIIFKVENGIIPAKHDLRDSLGQAPINTPSIINASIINASTTPDEVVQFAETQIGVPYVYASCDPKVGFDCSGFIKYVFNHFNIEVPRSSYGFTHMGETIPFNEAKTGDIILFKGTDSLSNDVGHIGLVVSNNNGAINFIHSTSGKSMAVTVTTFNDYYKKRFVRLCRVFKYNA